MNDLDDTEAIERLREAGCTASEIERLRRLRRDYAAPGGEQAPAYHHRFGFVRWLVTFLQEGTPTCVSWW